MNKRLSVLPSPTAQSLSGQLLFRSDASRFTVMSLRDLIVDVSVVDLTVEIEEVTTWMRSAQR